MDEEGFKAMATFVDEVRALNQYAAIPNLRSLLSVTEKLIKEYEEAHKTATARAQLHAKIMRVISNPEILDNITIEFRHTKDPQGQNFTVALGKGTGMDEIVGIVAGVFQSRVRESLDLLRNIRDEQEEFVHDTVGEYLNTFDSQ